MKQFSQCELIGTPSKNCTEITHTSANNNININNNNSSEDDDLIFVSQSRCEQTCNCSAVEKASGKEGADLISTTTTQHIHIMFESDTFTEQKDSRTIQSPGRAPDADSGIEDEDPNSPPSNSPHSNTPSSTTHLKPNGNGHVTLSSHRSLSPSTSYNELLDARTPACLESYSMEGVDQHNLLRRMHGTPPIAHSRELQKIAQNYADYLAEARIGEEIQKSSNFQIYGENILYIPYVCFMSAKQAVQLWYRQIRNIDLAEVSEERFNSISSFCQIVWRNTEALGIGVSFGRRGGCYIVANYYPKMELTLKNFFLNVPPPNTPMSVREEQYELWSSLRITYQNEEDGMSNANQDTLHVELTTVGANRLQKTWDMAVAVETVKKRLLSNPNSNASSRSTSPSRQ